jgi:hypothetical protein
LSPSYAKTIDHIQVPRRSRIWMSRVVRMEAACCAASLRSEEGSLDCIPFP